MPRQQQDLQDGAEQHCVEDGKAYKVLQANHSHCKYHMIRCEVHRVAATCPTLWKYLAILPGNLATPFMTTSWLYGLNVYIISLMGIACRGAMVTSPAHY